VDWFTQQNEFLTEIEEMQRIKQMFKKFLDVCKETRRVILQQSNLHLN